MQRTLCDLGHIIGQPKIAATMPELYSLDMSLTLKIVSREWRALGKDRLKTFGHDGGTIGRSLESDWCLPDTQRFLSSRHASIDFRSGSYYIVDTSKNGVFINGAEEPVGHGKPQRIFPGDRIRIGEYEITASIANVEDTRDTLLDSSHVDPVHKKQYVEAPDPTSYDLLDVEDVTGVDLEMLLEETDAGTLRPGNPEPEHAAGNRSLEAFFRGAGIDMPKLSAEETDQLLTKLGQVVRELVSGTIDCLHLRAVQKAQTKLTNTVIQPRENNRLKFSASFEEGFTRLFLEDSDEYMSSVDSARGAFVEIKEHQRLLLKATREALDEYLDRLEPEQLEMRASGGKKGALINATNKLKYWDLYKDVYSVLANRPADELPQPFLDALAKAYQQSAARVDHEVTESAQVKAS